MKPQHELVKDFAEGARFGQASHMFIEGDTIYSYGRHFPLAMRRVKGWGDGVEFIVNGDTYSHVTSQHTQDCIRYLKPNVQIPFSAMTSANLFRMFNHQLDGLSHIVHHTSDESRDFCVVCDREVRYVEEDESVLRHIADGSPICDTERSSAVRTEHRLGAVVLKDTNGVFWLSGIDEGEHWRYRAYFFCELPRRVRTVEEAYRSLKPRRVAMAERKGVPVLRQGDVFLIKTEKPKLGPGAPYILEHNRPIFENGTHFATTLCRNGGTVVTGRIYHAPGGWRRRAQHRPIFARGQWYEAIKNLAGRSYNARGMVD